MRPVTMTIDLDWRHIPELVCTGYPAVGGTGEHVAAVAKAIAESLGIEDYLGKPDRIHERSPYHVGEDSGTRGSFYSDGARRRSNGGSGG